MKKYRFPYIFLVLLAFTDGVVRYFYDKSFLLIILASFFLISIKSIKFKSGLAQLLIMSSSILIAFKSIGFVKTAFSSIINFSYKNFLILIYAYLTAQILFLLIELIFFSTGSKNFYLMTDFSYPLPLGLEGDSNYSFCTTVLALLILNFLSKISNLKLIFYVLFYAIIFRSTGGLIAFIFSIIIKKINLSKEFTLLIILSTTLLFLCFLYILPDLDFEIKRLLAEITTYRTDIWLHHMGYEPSIYTAEDAEPKQPHNFIIQMASYGYISLPFIISIIFLYLYKVPRKLNYLIIFWFISSISLNSGSSMIFLMLIIFINMYNSNEYKSKYE